MIIIYYVALLYQYMQNTINFNYLPYYIESKINKSKVVF